MFSKSFSFIQADRSGPGRTRGSGQFQKVNMRTAKTRWLAAQREFEEETGFTATGEFMPLRDLRQAGGKIVRAWAFEGDCDASQAHSNSFSMEWPPKSGTMREFPEVDRAAWYSIEAARTKLLKGQLGFLDELAEKTVSG